MNYRTVDLGVHFNSKLMTTEDEKEACTKTLKNCGFRNQDWHMFNADTMPASNEIIEIEKVPFQFPDKAFDKYDGISCEGQVLTVEKGNYSDLYLLGTAFDSCAGLEELYINGTKGENAAVEVYFHDWYYTKANTFWKYDSLNKKECIPGIHGTHLSDFSDRCIYFMHVRMSTEEFEVDSIELPLNPDMYLFALTLGK